MIQLFELFQQIHNSRFTYNDLKPENVMLSNDSHGNVRVSLIDFGYSQVYKDKSSGHINEGTEVDTFQGNLLFASPF